MSRRVLSILGALAIASTLTAAPVLAEPSAPPAPPIDWKPCKNAPKAECGTVEVPVDWSKPDGDTIQMAVARRKATNPEQRIGSLLYLPGGPGGSGVSGVLGGVPFSKEIQAKFDIVSFDPRGVMRSAGVRCDAELLRNRPTYAPDGAEHFQRIREHSQKLADSCRKHSGALIDNLDTVSVAKDLDALRAGLGEEQISLYGISYGTLTGQMYAEQFPQRVRALLLDSVMDHSLDTKGFVTTEAESAEDGFNEFVKWCAANESCALHGQDVPALFDSLYERAERGELHYPGAPKQKLTPEALSSTVIGAAYLPDWATLAKNLKTLRDQGNMNVAALAPPTLPDASGSFCADWNMDIGSAQGFQEMWDAQEKAAPHLRASVGWSLAVQCSNWPAETKNPQHKPKLDGSAPILIMNSQHDPATGYNWATSVDQQVKSAELLTYDGWGHGVYDRNKCTLDAADRYLVDLTMPKPDTHCPAVPPGQQPGTAMAKLAIGR